MRLLDLRSKIPTVAQTIRIGMDTSKPVFQLHGSERASFQCKMLCRGAV